MNIKLLLFKNEIEKEEKDIIKSKDIICPEYAESIKFQIIDYKKNYNNGKNELTIYNILLNEFEKT